MPSLDLRDHPRDGRGILLEAAPTRTLADLLPAAAPTAAPTAPVRATPSRRVQLAMAVITTVTLVLAWLALGRGGVAPAALPSAVPLPAPTVAPAAALPSSVPTANPAACTITHAAATFYAPAGDATGDALDAGTACRLVGWHSRFPDWRQITAGGGPLWVRVAVLDRADPFGPDLAPPPTATPPPPPPPTPIPPPPPTATPCIEPRYTAPLEVLNPGGGSIGMVYGTSCVSQEEAAANALVLRDRARAAADRQAHDNAMQMTSAQATARAR